MNHDGVEEDGKLMLNEYLRKPKLLNKPALTDSSLYFESWIPRTETSIHDLFAYAIK